jgi:protein-S-isoprenylcysteine O-methyltransferase Ste14
MPRHLEAIYVLILFGAYVGLWQWKRTSQERRTGVDPDVRGRAATPLQQFFARATRILTASVVVLIPLHAVGARGGGPFLERVAAIDGPLFDASGFLVGLVGLAICAWAQRTMGISWGVSTRKRGPRS